jgi:hypothetical protein
MPLKRHVGFRLKSQASFARAWWNARHSGLKPHRLRPCRLESGRPHQLAPFAKWPKASVLHTDIRRFESVRGYHSLARMYRFLARMYHFLLAAVTAEVLGKASAVHVLGAVMVKRQNARPRKAATHHELPVSRLAAEAHLEDPGAAERHGVLKVGSEERPRLEAFGENARCRAPVGAVEADGAHRVSTFWS